MLEASSHVSDVFELFENQKEKFEVKLSNISQKVKIREKS